MSGFTYGEAFMLMRYQDQVTGEIEVIWNSRDGVSPFAIPSRAGNQALHVEWERDERAAWHVPEIGDRIFVDMTPERARELAEQIVERCWDDPQKRMREAFASKRSARRHIASTLYTPGRGEPDLVEVTEELRAKFQARAVAKAACGSRRRARSG